MKKMLPIIGLYLGTFIILNVGMYFLLKMTQPNDPTLIAALHGDSTTVESADSAIVLEDREFDHEPDPVEEFGDSTHHDTTVNTTTDTEAIALLSEATDSTLMNPSLLGNAGEKTLSDSSHPAEAETGVALSDTPQSTAEISKLAKLLEGMKPGEAAVIAERLPTETIVQLVMRMKSRSGAKMMASLPVPVAASVATRMAELSGVKSPS